jgi:hypothetical protein
MTESWATSSAADGENRAMLEIATPDLYRLNAFRVLGLSVTVTATQLAKQQGIMEKMERLEIVAASVGSGLLPIDPPPDADAIRKAGQRLRNPEARLIDEVLWFWPLDLKSPEGDDGLTLLKERDYAGAHDFWSKFQRGDARRSAANHNLAVLHHALALDLEIDAEDNDPPDSALIAWRDKNWHAAFKYWVLAAADEGLRAWVVTRIHELDDPRLTMEVADQIWRTLPLVMSTVTIRLAGRAARKGNGEDVRRHLVYLANCDFNQSSISVIRDREAAPLVEQIRRLCDPIAQRSKADPDHADQLAQQLIADTKSLLAGIQPLLGEKHHLYQTACETVAKTVRDCVIDYGNKTEGWERCLPLLDQALELATDDGLRSRLQEDINQVEKNRRFGNLKPIRAAPSLRTTNSCGCTLYGHSDYDAETGSHMATYYFVILGIPIFPIRRYRVIQSGDTYRFLGKAPLRSGDKIHLAVSIGIVIFIIASAMLDSREHSTGRVASQSTTSYSTTPMYSLPGGPSTSASRVSGTGSSSLSSQIEEGRRFVRTLESQIAQMDSDLEALSVRIRRHKGEVDNFERRARLDLDVDRSLYQQAIDNYNRLVTQYNTQVNDRKQMYLAYKLKIDSVNEMVRQYNNGER